MFQLGDDPIKNVEFTSIDLVGDMAMSQNLILPVSTRLVPNRIAGEWMVIP